MTCRSGIMRSARLWRALCAAVAMSALTACGSAADGSAVEAASGAASSVRASASRPMDTYVTDCVEGNIIQRPATMTLSCADSGAALDGLTWSQWGGDTAVAKGSYSHNDCLPDCATGTVTRFPVSLRLSAPKGSASGRTYTQATLTFTGAVPDDVSREETFTLAK